MYSPFCRQFYLATANISRTYIFNGLSAFSRSQSRLPANLTLWSAKQSNASLPSSLSICQYRPLCTQSQNESNTVIYTGTFTTRVTRVKFFSFTTSLCGLILQPYLYTQASSLPTLIALSSFLGFFTFVTPFLLHMVTRRYVTKILYNKEEDSYCAELITFFCTKRQVHFKPGEAKVPDMGGMLTSIQVRGIPMLLDFDVITKDHKNHILGFDKPLNIEHESIVEDLAEAEKKK